MKEKQRIEWKDQREGEQILWLEDRWKHKGIFHKEIAFVNVITNLRAIKLKPENGELVAKGQVWYANDMDVIVMNSHRVSNRTSNGIYTGHGGSGVYMGQGRSNSQTYGDLVFMSEGQKLFTFSDIHDPSGKKSMIKAVQKQLRTSKPKIVSKV